MENINKITEIQVSYSTPRNEKVKVQNSEESYKLILACWSKHTIELQEEFKVLLLNNSNKVLGIYSCSKGGVTGTLVDAKLVFSVALKCNASAIILTHNHPSGTLKPSQADISLTNKLKEAGTYLDVKVLDHLIITKDGYFSFSDGGLM
tara:strand:+ start:31975 stop:32421 length:447 start_codon:yes stop_codon:yes gene_type:complete